jgi:hypothetical protein
MTSTPAAMSGAQKRVTRHDMMEVVPIDRRLPPREIWQVQDDRTELTTPS